MAVTSDFLRSILDYDPVTGIWTWRARLDRSASWNTRYAGHRADHAGPHGYRQLCIDKKSHYAHRLSFLYMTGSLPVADVDHKDLNKSNNRWDNLRLASKSDNQWNRSSSKNNTVGFKGVAKNSTTGRFVAQIACFGRRYNLGTFHTAEEAHAAYRDAATKLHGKFARAA